MYINELKIGNVILENNLILAPMAGVTDKAFRRTCKELGAGLVCTEMASSRAIFYNDEKTKKLLNIEEEKKPISVQIFGSDVNSMKVATKYANTFADIIDINMGCPAPKVVKNGDGSKLLLNLDLAEEIITKVVEVATVPVTVKIRKGWDKNNIVAVDIAKRIQRAGAKAITIHGRTKEEYFSGECDLEIIKQVKQAVNIPVIGNGNIIDEKTALEMFQYTGVDGIMIGRASLGNPWIFKNISTYLKTGKISKQPTLKERLSVILQQIEWEIEQKGEKTGINEMKKHIHAYTKKMPDSSRVREKVNKIENKQELIDCLIEYFNYIGI